MDTVTYTITLTSATYLVLLQHKELVTLTECISVLGYYLSAIITFKGVYYL
jgi:hypothetical protein